MLYTFVPERYWKSGKDNIGMQLSVETYGSSPHYCCALRYRPQARYHLGGQTSTYE